jgi:hypothetical protein
VAEGVGILMRRPGLRVWYLFPLAISKTGSKPEVGDKGVCMSVGTVARQQVSKDIYNSTCRT